MCTLSAHTQNRNTPLRALFSKVPFVSCKNKHLHCIEFVDIVKYAVLKDLIPEKKIRTPWMPTV
jgi:hypothetical protein